MQSYQERIQLDRYAVKDQQATPKIGDLVVVSIQRKFEQDGELNESREIGVVTRVGAQEKGVEAEYSVTLYNTAVPKESWEIIDKLNRGQLEILVEKTYADICMRVANGVIKNEPDNIVFRDAVYNAMINEMFVPGGRILAGIGRDNLTLTLFNCYVFPPPHDSRRGIIDMMFLLFDTFSEGGGVGFHCSSLRPRGAVVKKVNGRSSGAVSWMDLYSHLTGAVEQAGSRRGAAMIGLWIWHPDIIEFIEAKSRKKDFTLDNGQVISRDLNLLKNVNVSVLISDKFMEAVKADAMWDLVFPNLDDPTYDTTWNGDLEEWLAAGKKPIVYKRVRAKWLWDLIIKKAWESGEPGILFMDRANKMSNSYYYNKISCTNPCGEVLLEPFGVCNLGHINLAKFIRPDVEQFPEQEIDSESAIKKTDFNKFKEVITTAIRFLDNITDINRYHIPQTEEQQKKERRIGLGILGYAELLVRLGLRYGSPEAEKFTNYLFRKLSKYSYLASINLAKERGSFPAYDYDKFLASGFMKIHDEEVIAAVREHGIRNVTINTCAPTGSVATMLNTTTGIEPYFLAEWTARSRIGIAEEEASVLSELKHKFGKKPPAYFVTTDTVTPEEHVRIQAAAQRWIDSSIAKTVNLPNNATVEDVSNVYNKMYELGCKGGTIYRDRSRDKQVLYHKDNPATKVEITDSYMHPDSGLLRPSIKAGLSVTISQPVPNDSWVHGTIRMHPTTGEPYDVFLSSGKGDLAADVQALGRLISVILRWPDRATINQATRLEIIRDQLYRIPGGQQVGIGTKATISMPDGIAQLLQRYLAGDFPLSSLPLGTQPMENYINVLEEESETVKVLRKLISPPDSKNEYKGSMTDSDTKETVEENDNNYLLKPDIMGNSTFETCPECKQNGLLRQIGHCPHCVICGCKLC